MLGGALGQEGQALTLRKELSDLCNYNGGFLVRRISPIQLHSLFLQVKSRVRDLTRRHGLHYGDISLTKEVRVYSGEKRASAVSGAETRQLRALGWNQSPSQHHAERSKCAYRPNPVGGDWYIGEAQAAHSSTGVMARFSLAHLLLLLSSYY